MCKLSERPVFGFHGHSNTSRSNHRLFSCSRHTVAFVPQSDRIYTFGLGAYGQLGSGDTKSCNTPVVAKGPWMKSSLHEGDSVMKVIAGGDHCFVLCSKAGVS